MYKNDLILKIGVVKMPHEVLIKIYKIENMYGENQYLKSMKTVWLKRMRKIVLMTGEEVDTFPIEIKLCKEILNNIT